MELDMAQEGVPTITIDEVEYVIEDLSGETKELLGLHQEATNKLLDARRKAAIHELAAQSLANLISNSVKEQAAEAELVPDEPNSE